MVSERRRAAILGLIISPIFVARALYQASYGGGGELPGRGAMLGVLAGWIGIEALIFASVNDRIRADKERVPFRAYVSGAVEIAMPTIMMAVMCRYDHPLNVLTSSINYLYFLIIILSPLRLDAWLSIFTGALAAAGYGILVLVHADALAREYVGSAALMRLTFLMRGAFLLSGGLAAGFVSHRIRTTLIETLGEVQERERVVALFGQHVSPEVVDRLLAQPPREDSELLELCVMVLDIRNFTTFSEACSPDEVVRYLNTLWSFMVRTVNEHHGIVNKFLGDGFLAIFGAPISTGIDCLNAIAAAQRILSELTELAASGALPPTQIGIALHAGPAIVGSVGSADRKEYTVIGDVVNVAFRIEQLNKELGSTLLISEPVRQVVGIDAERVPPIPIRGRREPVELFRLA